jgi:hypothetical protein
VSGPRVVIEPVFIPYRVRALIAGADADGDSRGPMVAPTERNGHPAPRRNFPSIRDEFREALA